MSKTQLIRDHHLLTRNLKLNGKYISNDGGDEGVSVTDSGVVNLHTAGSAIIHKFDHDSYVFYSDSDTNDYFELNVIASGKTIMTTVDDSGAQDAHIVLQPQGEIQLRPGDQQELSIYPITKTASSTNDTTINLTETLNLDTGAGGSDVHYGLKYEQTQTDLTGWDSVYLMYLEGGGNTLSIDKNALLGITTTGTAKSVTDVLTITNDVNAADMDGTGSAIKFNQWYYDGSSPAIEDAANIVVATEADWTTTSTTRDSYMAFSTSLNGTLAEKLRITSGGDLVISGGDLKLDATERLYLDGGSDTYIAEVSADIVRHYVGSQIMMQLSEDDGVTGNLLNFVTTGVGFTQNEPTYNATDTHVYFNRSGNKQHLTFTSTDETIVDVHLYFPNVSCNCVLLIKQHGSGGGAVTNWKTWDQSSGNESTVVWAGGTAPTLTTTASKTDIISFYWDNTNHKAYGVATLNF